GPVSFRNGERTAVVELIQFQGDSGVLVGEFNTSNQQVRLMTQLLKFKGPGPAKDQTLVHLQHRQVSLILYILISSVATGTIFITLIILCIVIISHRRWPLRSGSSSQDELLLLGLLLSSSSVLFSGLDRTSLPDRTLEVLCSVSPTPGTLQQSSSEQKLVWDTVGAEWFSVGCYVLQVRLWTLSVGHTAGFAAVFTRTWRVYCLCSIKKKHRTRLQETGCVPLWILLLDVFVLTFWQILDPLRWVVLQHSLEEYLDDQDILIRSYSGQCSSTNMDLWLTAVYGYKAPLLGLGCFLAWNIRTADLGPPAVSCALLALSMFSVTVFSMSGVLGSLLTSSDPSVQFCLCSVLILSCNLLILIGLFGPQICCMLCSSTKLQQASEMQDEAAEEEGVERLKRLNQDLRSQSAQLDVQVETITMELSEMLQDETGAGVTSLTLTHEALVCEEKPSGLENINSPDHVQRRLSMQLPILHHSYLPVIGGVSSSSSSLFVSQEAFAYRHHDHFLHT
ncbi:hypothetical protein ILYODFUR_030699, partial [Ilyodon furcidens]